MDFDVYALGVTLYKFLSAFPRANDNLGLVITGLDALHEFNIHFLFECMIFLKEHLLLKSKSLVTEHLAINLLVLHSWMEYDIKYAFGEFKHFKLVEDFLNAEVADEWSELLEVDGL